MNKRRRAYRTGTRAEKWAAFFLRLKGYKILKTRYKTPVGEIDLIAAKGKTLIFVEVKARAEIENALYAIDKRAQMRIQKAAGHFVIYHPHYGDYDMQFDVFAFGGGCWPQHLDNAWQAHDNR